MHAQGKLGHAVIPRMLFAFDRLSVRPLPARNLPPLFRRVFRVLQDVGARIRFSGLRFFVRQPYIFSQSALLPFDELVVVFFGAWNRPHH